MDESDASDEQADTDDEAVTGTFLVTHADEESAVLRDADTGQVHTLSENPGLDAETVIEATVTPEPPMGVTYDVREVAERREVAVRASGETPTTQAREIAAEQSVGEVTRQERAGDGELHVLTVPDDRTEVAVDDVVNDRETRLLQAARAGASHVEVRSEEGVVSVRYLP
ncbi:DUF5812 family protein [Halobaculum sp. MBLA0143]|uniref:DUF5812 family protein n=1 Tax=Halobaculum sp. MBLA0143 TaxID=3079933 RepID=UPI0035236A4E